MIHRLVKMTFRPGEEERFIAVFNHSCEQIAAFQGCNGVKLLRDKEDSSVFFTYSLWNDADDLRAYRNSELFRSTWAATKVLFADKPEVWSTELQTEVPNLMINK